MTPLLSIKLNHLPGYLLLAFLPYPPSHPDKGVGHVSALRQALHRWSQKPGPHPPDRGNHGLHHTKSKGRQEFCPTQKGASVRVKRVGNCGCVFLALAALSASACGAVTVRDDTGHPVTLARAARRVVSLAPSATEMLFAIGAQGELVGASNADDYPPAARKLPKVGSFSGPDLERIVAARPDLVVAATGNPLALIDRLHRLHLPVYVSYPSTVAGVLRNMLDLAGLTGREVPARRAVHALEERLKRV